tara:strand:- start:915 stop:1889 length:975 start_codon:yes stop_codon:yes gene_type:complete
MASSLALTLVFAQDKEEDTKLDAAYDAVKSMVEDLQAAGTIDENAAMLLQSFAMNMEPVTRSEYGNDGDGNDGDDDMPPLPEGFDAPSGDGAAGEYQQNVREALEGSGVENDLVNEFLEKLTMIEQLTHDEMGDGDDGAPNMDGDHQGGDHQGGPMAPATHWEGNQHALCGGMDEYMLDTDQDGVHEGPYAVWNEDGDGNPVECYDNMGGDMDHQDGDMDHQDGDMDHQDGDMGPDPVADAFMDTFTGDNWEEAFTAAAETAKGRDQQEDDYDEAKWEECKEVGENAMNEAVANGTEDPQDVFGAIAMAVGACNGDMGPPPSQN